MKTNADDSLNRLSRIEGQVRGVHRMVSDDESSLDIITQIQAARAALQSVSKIILDEHLRHCVTDVFDKGDEATRDEKLEEIMTVIKRMGS